MGRRALRGAPRGGAAPAAQGSRTVRQSAAGDRLSGAGRRLVAEARTGRRARHPDRARADRRRLFRRAEGDPRSRQRPEARHRHPGLRHLRDRAHRPRRLRAGAHAAQQGHLDGEAQRHEVGRAVERGGHRHPQGRLYRRDAGAHAGRRRRHAAGARAQAVRRDRHRQPVRRHAVRRRRHADRLARHAAVGVAGRARRRRPASARRSTSRCTARRPTLPARASPTRSP